LKQSEETAKDIINSIAERDIYTGDQVEIVIVDRNGVHVKREAIRRD
jgi:20S proteasome alpha/beta subunit